MKSYGFIDILSKRLFSEAELMYSNICRVSIGPEKLREAIQRFVLASGTEINAAYYPQETAKLKRNNSTEILEEDPRPSTSSAQLQGSSSGDPVKWIEANITLKSHMDEFLEKSFGKEKLVQNVINSAMSSAFSEAPRSAEFLSLFIDSLFKNSSKKVIYSFPTQF